MIIPGRRVPLPPWLPNCPEPQPGQSYFVASIRKDIVEKIAALDANGHWERELTAVLERTIEDFYKRLPIDMIRTPRAH